MRGTGGHCCTWGGWPPVLGGRCARGLLSRGIRRCGATCSGRGESDVVEQVCDQVLRQLSFQLQARGVAAACREAVLHLPPYQLMASISAFTLCRVQVSSGMSSGRPGASW